MVTQAPYAAMVAQRVQKLLAQRTTEKAMSETESPADSESEKLSSASSDSGALRRRRPDVQKKPLRRVSFSPQEVSYHEVTPYAEVYGVHPREFHFDRDSSMVPVVPWWWTPTETEDDTTSDDSGDEHAVSILIE